MDIEQKNSIVAVFIDLKRAFETIIMREILIKKFGVKGKELQWL
jgi:hypothetical protein